MIDVEYVFQETDDLPEGFSCPEERVKPWGTGHAVLAARDLIDEDFAAVNADDFYGRDSLTKISGYLSSGIKDPCCMAGFVLKNTLTENGTVSRGVCKCDSEGFLSEITERTKIKRNEKGRTVYLEGDREVDIEEDAIVSMNCWGLPKEFLKYAMDDFKEFLRSDDLMSKEFYLPVAVMNYLKRSGNRAKVLETSSKWFGVTYKEDREAVVGKIREQIAAGVYPKKLFP